MKKKLATTALLVLIALSLIGCAAATTGNIVVVEMSSVAVLASVADTNGLESAMETAAPDIVEVTLAPTAEPTPAITAPTAAPSAAPVDTPEPTPEYDVEELDAKKGYVAAGEVNLRSGPDTDYEIVGGYERGDKLTVTGESGDWYRVEIDGAEGFMLKEYVGLGTMPTPTPTPKATAKPTATPKATATPEPAATTAPSNGSASSAGGYSAADIYLVAQLVSRESGKDYDGYRAVANVILNRVLSSKFPNTVEGVVFQSGQFSPANDEAKLRAVTPSSTVVSAVEAVFGGDTVFGSNVVYFRSASKGTSWSGKTYCGTFGGNVFFSP